jgi:hypothetical protein
MNTENNEESKITKNGVGKYMHPNQDLLVDLYAGIKEKNLEILETYSNMSI